MRWSASLLLVLIACGDNLESTELEVAFDQTPPALSNQTHAAFAFHVDGVASRLTCTLDTGSAVACSSPFAIDVAEGEHTLTITATGDAPATAGASFTWKVDTPPP